MRILHVGKFYHPYKGGIESFLRDLVQSQVKAGMDASVLVHHQELFRATRTENPGGINVTRVLSLGHFVYAPIAPTFGYQLKRMLADFKPDILHLHLPNPSAFWVLALMQRRPIVIQWQSDVVTSQIDKKLGIFYPSYRWFENALLKKSSRIIASSRNYLDESLALRAHRDKCQVITLGMDPARLHRPSREEIASLRRRFPQKNMVLSVGRFTYYKGFDYLIEAARLVPDTCFVIIGEGSLRRPMKQRIERLGLEDRVLLPGLMPDRELHTFMAACDVFCLPSIERTEAFGIVLLEAMAFGKPLITTDIEGSGVNWVNLAGETGLVVQTADAKALADGIRHLLSDSEARQQMGRQAHQRLNRHFHIEAVSKQILNLYSTLQTPPRTG